MCSVKFHSPVRSVTTTSRALALFPSLVPVISTVSERARAWTSPAAETVACVWALLLQVTGRSTSSLPAESRALAVSCCVRPITTVAAAGVTST